jgi:hypothetical protein
VIELFDLSRQGIFEKGADLYRSGWSLREIAIRLKVSKTHVRQSFVDYGVDLRSGNGRPKTTTSTTVRRHIGIAPYGFFSLNGKLSEDPREQHVVEQILNLRSQGLAYNAIAKELNRLKVKPRNSKAWDHSIIRSIIKRYESQKISPKEKSYGSK